MSSQSQLRQWHRYDILTPSKHCGTLPFSPHFRSRSSWTWYSETIRWHESCLSENRHQVVGFSLTSFRETPSVPLLRIKQQIVTGVQQIAKSTFTSISSLIILSDSLSTGTKYYKHFFESPFYQRRPVATNFFDSPEGLPVFCSVGEVHDERTLETNWCFHSSEPVVNWWQSKNVNIIIFMVYLPIKNKLWCPRNWMWAWYLELQKDMFNQFSQTLVCRNFFSEHLFGNKG